MPADSTANHRTYHRFARSSLTTRILACKWSLYFWWRTAWRDGWNYNRNNWEWYININSWKLIKTYLWIDQVSASYPFIWWRSLLQAFSSVICWLDGNRRARTLWVSKWGINLGSARHDIKHWFTDFGAWKQWHVQKILFRQQQNMIHLLEH